MEIKKVPVMMIPLKSAMLACTSLINYHRESIKELIQLKLLHLKLNKLFKKLFFLNRIRLRIKFTTFLSKISISHKKRTKILKIRRVIKNGAILSVLGIKEHQEILLLLR